MFFLFLVDFSEHFSLCFFGRRKLFFVFQRFEPFSPVVFFVKPLQNRTGRWSLDMGLQEFGVHGRTAEVRVSGITFYQHHGC